MVPDTKVNSIPKVNLKEMEFFITPVVKCAILGAGKAIAFMALESCTTRTPLL